MHLYGTFPVCCQIYFRHRVSAWFYQTMETDSEAHYHLFFHYSQNNMLKMSFLMTKPTKWHVRPAKTQLSLGIRPVWSESSPCAQSVAKVPRCLNAASKDSDQNGRMRCPGWSESSLGAHAILLVLSWGGSNVLNRVSLFGTDPLNNQHLYSVCRKLFGGIYSLQCQL